MTVIPLSMPWEPDKGPMASQSLDTIMNIIPTPEGWMPAPSLSAFSQPLPSECKGAWWFRNDAGVFNTIAATQTRLYRLNPATLGWVDISRVSGPYIGPADGENWTAAQFGQNLYVSNINDPLQAININTLTNFANAPGSPPQAKNVATIGDFLFLANLKVGATTWPRKWQHCKINDPTNWVIDGSAGASDDQEIPDGEDILAILPMAGSSARIIQKRAKRALTFTPGSFVSFSQSDIDATRGAVAAHTCVPLGSNQYFYLNESGFFMNDEHLAIGGEKIDRFFGKAVNPARVYAVKAAVDTGRKIVWITYEDPQSQRKTIAYHWFLQSWFQCNDPVVLFVSSVSPGYVLDSLPLTLDSYPAPPLDSPYWAGGVVNFGAFKADNRMYLFGGARPAATIETATTQLTEGTGAYCWGAEVLGNLDSFTVQHGTAFTPDQPLTWSAQRTRSGITGIAPFSKDARWHRFRININQGANWTHLHGIRPYARSSGQA
jgi:hypothetical protein